MENEKRLIYAEEAKAALTGLDCATDELIEWTIDRIPTVDAVEVVRCMDCDRSHNYGTPGKDWFVCKRMNVNRKPDDFCSRGVRRCRDAAD